MNVNDLSTATPVEFDTELAGLYGVQYAAEDTYNEAIANIRKAAEPNRRWISRTRRESYQLTLNEAIVKLNDDGNPRSGRLVTAYAAARDQFNAANAAIEPYEAEFTRRGGWERAFLVLTNGRGHVHTTMSCSTCYPTTRYAWMPELSGQDRQTIIDGIREDACTVCYPGAPTGPRTVFTAEERAERAAAKAERDAKAAKKAATGITHADGTELRSEYGVLKTERSAEIEYVKILADVETYNDGRKLDSDEARIAGGIALALAHKRGVDVVSIVTELGERVTAKVKRDTREAEQHAKRLGLSWRG